MKLPIMILCFVAAFAPAVADDGQKLVERKTCEQIKTEIASIKSVEKPTEEQLADLKQLTSMQRTNCATKGTARRAIPRTQVPSSETPSTSAPVVKSDALTEYLNAKRANCEMLKSEIAKLSSDADKTEMQRIYDMDCVEHTEVATANVAPGAEKVVPEKTDEEWAKEFDANLAAGLCGDGTKPNRFGCCTDEVFKDLGDAGFACCPKSGGIDSLCFPPLK